jgi:hypothetical protein
MENSHNETQLLDRRLSQIANNWFKKLAVQLLNKVQFFNQTFMLADSFTLRNLQLLVAANR